ncbi:MAG: hypothetical protein M3R27_03410 [Bacteroidota bacterium]|nr:hypothetical protein [Bacteroidota bacterium]
MMQEKISYNQERDFGSTFNIAIKFIRENFKILIQSITFIAGPFILLSAIATVLYQNSIAQAAGNLFRDGRFHFFDLINYQYGISFIISSLSNLIMTAVVFEVMKLYSIMPASEITVSKVGIALLNDFKKLFWTMILFYLIIVGIGIVVGGISIGFSTAHWGFAVLAIFLLVIFLLLAGPNVMYILSITYLVRIVEQNDEQHRDEWMGKPKAWQGVVKAINRARFGMKSNYWWTWLMMLCLFIIVMIIAVALNLPASILGFIIGLTHMDATEYSTLFSIMKVATNTFYLILSAFVFIIMAFHHFSVMESKEGTGLMARINEIGQKQAHEFNQDY